MVLTFNGLKPTYCIQINIAFKVLFYFLFWQIASIVDFPILNSFIHFTVSFAVYIHSSFILLQFWHIMRSHFLYWRYNSSAEFSILFSAHIYFINTYIVSVKLKPSFYYGVTNILDIFLLVEISVSQHSSSVGWFISILCSSSISSSFVLFSISFSSLWEELLTLSSTLYPTVHTICAHLSRERRISICSDLKRRQVKNFN